MKRSILMLAMFFTLSTVFTSCREVNEEENEIEMEAEEMEEEMEQEMDGETHEEMEERNEDVNELDRVGQEIEDTAEETE
ncbi:hypothetical protein RM549_05365 [Salegentibacter sp. F188]|uniref:Uncharacterized protein n=1 Tax=Autumnicola patrickiae TaxID=3075591 RepID=A0ABU3DZZ4_9FLAO|nr:hypothetical protein [Salegentibacter sp. F188]MDT0689203.1 hypothetical protein [Salegentibacter sp. F188]